jgi:hypothetical protein
MVAKTHGRDTRDPTYSKWAAMKQRCLNPKHARYHRYGGRGIVVCERWLHSFENFLADMGECPAGDWSIERENSDGNYEPGNCSWLERPKQGSNTSRVLTFIHEGKTIRGMPALSRATGVLLSTLKGRHTTGILEAMTPGVKYA